MQTRISTRHGTISEATREKITAKVEKLKRFYDRISSAEVTIDLEIPSTPAIDIKLTTEPQRDFVVQSQEGELFTSLDDALRKLEQQLKKFKEKLTDKRPE